MAIAATSKDYPCVTAAAKSRPLFEVGDEVRMRTEMKAFMVAALEDDGQVICEWLDSNDEHHSWSFDQRMLVLVRSAP